MATPVTYASERSFWGVAKETIQGTPVAMTATIPLDKFDPQDHVTFLDDKAMRGSMAETYDTVAGPSHSEVSFGGPVYGDTTPYFILGLLGDVTTVGASAPYTHTGALLNSGTGQPTTYTLTDYSGVTATSGARQYPGQMVESVTFKFNVDGLFTWDGKSQGFPSVALGVAPVAAPGAILTVPSWKMAVGIGGPATAGTLVNNVIEGEFTFARKVTALHTASATQAPYVMRAGKVGVTGKFKVIAADEAHLLSMLANTRQQMQFVLDNGLAAAANVKWTFDFQKVSFRAATIDRGGDGIAYNVTWTAEANSTNAGASGGVSPAKVAVINALPAATFV